MNIKLTFMMLCLSGALILLMWLLNLYSERALLQETERRTVELAEAIHLAIEETVGTGEKDYMKLYYRLKELKPRGIREINIIDGATRIRASTNPFKIGETTPEEITELIFQSELGKFVTKKGTLYHLVLPVVVKGEHQGYIHTVISTEELIRLMRRNTKYRLMATLLVFMVGVAVAALLSRRYTRPIREVVESVRAVASGDLSIRLPVKERDEIGVLKRSFNEMAEKLSEMRKLEERLREAEHLSSIGELSRSIAHELRNPLNFISLTVDHLLSRLKGGDAEGSDTMQELLRNVKEEVKRLDRIVNQFLAYGRPLRIQRQPVSVVALLRDSLSLVRAKAAAQAVQVEEEYEIPEARTLLLDPELIKTSLLNILQNALQAMPAGGRLRVRVYEAPEGVTVEVSDTGEGIPPEVLDRVFEPFFTTKKEGIGLGLALTKRVVEEHGGRVNLTSERGRGTTVQILLPEVEH